VQRLEQFQTSVPPRAQERHLLAQDPGRAHPSVSKAVGVGQGQPEHRNKTAAVTLKYGVRSQVGSPRSDGFATLSTDEHCRNTALPLHAIIKVTFDLTGHLSDIRNHGGDPVPTCAPSDRPEQHNQPIIEHDPLAPQPT
jgi:hypothetical protein